MVTDTSKNILKNKKTLVMEDIEKTSQLISDYNQRIEVLQTARTIEQERKRTLQAQLIDIKQDIGEEHV